MNTPVKKSTLQTEDKYIVRLPDGMRGRIAEEAKKNSRSMNAEIIARLEKSFREDPLEPTSLAAIQNQIVGLVDENTKMSKLLTSYLNFVGVELPPEEKIKP